jgi:hypothetical protein
MGNPEGAEDVLEVGRFGLSAPRGEAPELGAELFNRFTIHHHSMHRTDLAGTSNTYALICRSGRVLHADLVPVAKLDRALTPSFNSQKWILLILQGYRSAAGRCGCPLRCTPVDKLISVGQHRGNTRSIDCRFQPSAANSQSLT